MITTTSAANAVLISMYFAVQMNLLPDGDDTRYYIAKFGKYMGMPNLLMTISFIGLFLALCFALVAQDRVHGCIQSVIMMVFFLGAYFFTRVTAAGAHTRLKLKSAQTRSNGAGAGGGADCTPRGRDERIATCSGSSKELGQPKV